MMSKKKNLEQRTEILRCAQDDRGRESQDERITAQGDILSHDECNEESRPGDGDPSLRSG